MGKNYDTDAERRSIDVWVCKSCGRCWPVKGKQEANWKAADAERAARTCCSENSPCFVCGDQRVRYRHHACDVCADRRSRERWGEREVRPLEFPLTAQDDDLWFFDIDELLEYCDEHDVTPESLLLRICKRRTPRTFEPDDFWRDDISSDDHDPTDVPVCIELAHSINEWAKNHLVSYEMGPYRPDLNELEP